MDVAVELHCWQALGDLLAAFVIWSVLLIPILEVWHMIFSEACFWLRGRHVGCERGLRG